MPSKTPTPATSATTTRNAPVCIRRSSSSRAVVVSPACTRPPYAPRRLLHRDSVAHRVLGHDVWFDELEQVVGAAGLGADAAAAVAPEGLAADHRARDVAVHVEVAYGRPAD